MGPGYLGRKRDVSQTERQALCAEFRRQGEDPPPYLDIEPNWIERRAKLFEAGDFPDKGVTITLDDLDRLAANFDLPVPIWIEHSDSPLELGYLTEVSAEDGELFGLLSLTEEANALIERSGARSLSIGLNSDLSQIREVSLVRNPRVASAQLYSDGLRFDGELEFACDWRALYEHTIEQQRVQAAENQIQTWIAAGQILPAQARYAKALLAHESRVQFDGETVAIKDLVSKLIGSQPRHSMLGEAAPQSVEDASALLLLPEEVAFYRRHFPDVSLESIAQKKALRS